MEDWGIRTRTVADPSERKIHREKIQDVEPIIEANKAEQKYGHDMEFGRHIGSIPFVILERWINEDGINYLSLDGDDFHKLICRKLRDPDWRWLRTTEKAF